MVPADNPVTSTFTVWSASAVAIAVPLATTLVNAASIATVQLTSTGAPSGLVIRVHKMTASASGSPLATP